MIQPSVHHERGWLDRLVKVSISHPDRLLLLWLLVAAVCSFGVVRLRVDTGTTTFLNRSGVAWKEYQDSLSSFGGDEIVVIALASETPYDPKILNEIFELTGKFEALPGVRRVDSLASVPIISLESDGSLSLNPALSERTSGEPQEIAKIIKRISVDRIARRNFVSNDGRAFGINLLLDEDLDRGRDVVVSEVRHSLSGKKAWVSGVPIFRTEVNFRTYRELFVFVPLTLIVVGFVVYLACQSLAGSMISLAASGIGTWVVLGAMGFLDTPLSLSTMILPSILLALGCAYMMHILAGAKGARSADELTVGILGIVRPVALSGLTTAIGFLAMSTVEIDAIRELGVYGAIGVVTVLAATLSVGPAALSLFPTGGGFRFRTQLLREVNDRWVFPLLKGDAVTLLAAGWLLCLFSVSELLV